MRSAFALRIFSGKIILIFRVWSDRVCAAMKAPVGLSSGRAVCVSRWKGFALTSSAERSKRFFHKWGRRGKQHLQSESAILPLRLPREKAFQPSLQAWLKCKLKKQFRYLCAEQRGAHSKSFHLPAARIPNHPPPSCNFGAKGVEYSHNQIQGSS